MSLAFISIQSFAAMDGNTSVFGYVSLVLDALVEIASLGCREKQETLLVHQSCNT